jgi:hypothetical protein
VNKLSLSAQLVNATNVSLGFRVAALFLLFFGTGITSSVFANNGSVAQANSGASYGNISYNNGGYRMGNFGSVYSNNLSNTTEKEIIIIIPSYHNIDWYERNLASVFAQKYEKYKVVYITDDPQDTDHTHAAVVQYVQKMGQAHRCTLIKNTVRKGGLGNLYHAIHACPDHAIVLTLDGDDWLKDEYVLARLNKAYQDPHVWMTYGQFETWPMGPKGFCQEIPQAWVTHNVIRDAAWVTSHLRTFYAWFFKKIKLKDLLHNHDFFMVTWDKAFMYPMLEMAHGRWKFIPDVLYVYNAGTPLNDYKVNGLEQLRCEKIICSRERYAALPQHYDYLKDKAEPRADFFIYSHDNPAQLRTCLTSLALMDGLARVTVLWRTQDPVLAAEYGKVAGELSGYQYKRIEKNTRLSDVLSTLLAGEGAATYCVYTQDNFVATQKIDLTTCIQALEDAGAYCFNLACATHNYASSYPGIRKQIAKPTFVALGNDIYAWQFSDGEYNWRNPYCQKAVCRTQDLKSLVEATEFDSFDQLHQACAYARFDLDEVGLCFGELKVIAN